MFHFQPAITMIAGNSHITDIDAGRYWPLPNTAFLEGSANEAERASSHEGWYDDFSDSHSFRQPFSRLNSRLKNISHSRAS